MPEDFRLHPEVTRARKKIEILDKKILKLFKARFKQVSRLAYTKLMMDMKVENPAQEAKLYKKWKKTFKGTKVDPDFLDELFDLVTEYSKKEQSALFDKNRH